MVQNKGRLYPKLIQQCLEALEKTTRELKLAELNSIIPHNPHEPMIITTGMNCLAFAEHIESRIDLIQTQRVVADIRSALSFIKIVVDLVMRDGVNDQLERVISWAFGHTFANREIPCFKMDLNKIAPEIVEKAKHLNTSEGTFELARYCLDRASAYIPDENDPICPDTTPEATDHSVNKVIKALKRIKFSKK